MARDSRLPTHVVREAAELLAARAAMDPLLPGDPGAGPAIAWYLARLARAKGIREQLLHVPPAPQMGMHRPLTVFTAAHRGGHRVVVVPNLVSKEDARKFADELNGGLLDRDGVWGDARYVGMVSQCFGPDGMNAWWTGEPQEGVAARAAWAAISVEQIRKLLTKSSGGLAHHLHDSLFETTRPRNQGGPKSTFSDPDDPYAACWTVGELDRILRLRRTVRVKVPKASALPLDFFRHRGNLGNGKVLGYGEILAFWLTLDRRGPEKSQAEAAAMLGLQDRKDASALARSAKRKLGPRRTTLYQLFPPFPAGSQSSSDLRGDASAKPPSEHEVRRGGA